MSDINDADFLNLKSRERDLKILFEIKAINKNCPEQVKKCNRKFKIFGIGGVVVGFLILAVVVLIGPEACARFLISIR